MPLCPWDSPGKNTGVGCRALRQGIFLSQGDQTLFPMSPALAGEFLTTSATWESLPPLYELPISPSVMSFEKEIVLLNFNLVSLSIFFIFHAFCVY